MAARVVVATGAFDCVKSTMLAYLRDSDILERGVFDPIQYARFHARDGHPPPVAVQPHAHYTRVLLFEVMPELQRSRWGKTREQRVAEAQTVNEQLERAYPDAGHHVITVPAGTVAERAAAVLALLS